MIRAGAAWLALGVVWAIPFALAAAGHWFQATGWGIGALIYTWAATR